MNKGNLVVEVAKVVKSKRMAEDAVSCVFEAMTKSLAKGAPVLVVGFGTLSIGKRKARVGRNPQTGAAIKIPARKYVKFSAGKALKKAVNK